MDCELGDKKTVDRETYLDTTLCIQVVAPKLQERRLVEAMKVIEGMLEKGKRAGGLERGARL
jgi:amidase